MLDTVVWSAALALLAQAPARPVSPPPATRQGVTAVDAGTPSAADLPIFRLPAGVRPTRQRVALTVVPDRESFSGQVEISLLVDAPRDDLWVSARGLHFRAGKLRTAGQDLPVRIESDDTRGAARVSTGSKVPAGPATLLLEFDAPYNAQLVGVYRLKTPGGWAAYTQFEAIDARRAFPCFDEPGFKIPWDLELTVPAGLLAFANTPEVQRQPVSGGLVQVRFATTRPLSSYLVAFVVGAFDVVSPPALPPKGPRQTPLQVRGIASRGRGPELAHALGVGGELLPRLEQWFGIAFPYEKLDHVAEPDFAYGAMENAGLITYAEQYLLSRKGELSTEDRRDTARVLAHEMAHQWFGDLVTMQFWDDVWLNESFATLMETEIVGPWDPALRADIALLQEVLRAMDNDELESSRPIRTPMRTEGDLRATDVAVLYPKGAAVLSMFQGLLGRDAFRAAIRRYIEAHADGNATTEDLVAALSTEKDLRPAMLSFIDQPGVPRVRGTLACDRSGARLSLHQERARPLGSTAPSLRWKIPVCIRVENAPAPRCTLLESDDAVLDLPAARCPRWVHLNAGAQGYYRWLLPGPGLAALVKSGWGTLLPAERLSAADAILSSASDGVMTVSEAMSWIGTLIRDPEPSVPASTLRFLTKARLFWSTPEDDAQLRAFMRASARPLMDRLGWVARAGESPRISELRSDAVRFLALDAGDPQVLARAAALGRSWLGTDGRIHPDAVSPDLRDVAVRAAGRAGDQATFDLMEARLLAAEDGTTRTAIARALGGFLQPELAERARALALTTRLRNHERGSLLFTQARTPELRAGVAAWVIQHQEQLAAVLSESGQQLIPALVLRCSEQEGAQIGQELAPLARIAPTVPFEIRKMEEWARVCGATRAVQAPALAEFLSHSGAPVRQAATRQ
ncbi:MAG: M1 family metallopeptidase [Myxococcaceae bacterium]